MGFSIFYRIIYETARYHEEEKKALWDMVQGDEVGTIRQRVYDWCKEQLELFNIPDGAFKDVYLEDLRRSEGELDAMIEAIQDDCEPDSDDESDPE